MTRTKAAIAAAVLLATGAWAQNLRLSQIDASRLLLTQTVRLYVSATDQDGQPVAGLQGFRVEESADGEHFAEAPVSGVRPAAAGAEGIGFLLLIDNSGSMYDTIAGRPTTDAAAMRITAAREAVRSFLASMTHPADTAGLVAYNTRYATLAEPQRDKARVAALLDTITKPLPDEAYTELYASIGRAATGVTGAGPGGRKAIVVLSDGEDFPYARHSGKSHPERGWTPLSPDEAIRRCQEEGVSVYAISFGAEKDRNLQRIAAETGGAIFDAGNREELQGVYRRIHTQVAGEYVVSYRAGMAPAERTFVRVTLPGAAAVTRFYFSSTVFGLPMASLTPLLLVPLLAAAALFWLLTRLKLEKRPGPATLEVLTTRVGRAQTRVVPLAGTKTVIGGSTSANMTITGNPAIKQEHATILYDPKKKSYTVVGEGDITVNNQAARKRVLEPGDVINVAGATIVFDEGEKE